MIKFAKKYLSPVVMFSFLTNFTFSKVFAVVFFVIAAGHSGYIDRLNLEPHWPQTWFFTVAGMIFMVSSARDEIIEAIEKKIDAAEITISLDETE